MHISPKVSCRGKPRIIVSFPARMRGVDSTGEPFDIDAVVNNISSSGIYVRMSRRVLESAKVSIVMRLSSAADPRIPAPCVAIRGEVLRVNSQPDGSYGVAVSFKRYRFV